MTRRAIPVTALVLLATLTGVAPAPAATIRLSGQQITQVVVADLAYFYRHEARRPPRFELNGGGTAAGIADTVRGISDGALVSRALGPDDPPGLRLTTLATSGVCLVSHHTNPVPSITRALLQDIVAGRVTSWSQVPGSTRTDDIVPVALDPGTGAASVFEQVFVDDATPIAWKATTLLTSLQARNFVEQTPAAFAYLDLAFTEPVHPMDYEGVPCTRATVQDGTYPASRPIGVVTHGRPKPALRRFLRWSLTDRTARRVIATRYIPVSSAKASAAGTRTIYSSLPLQGDTRPQALDLERAMKLALADHGGRAGGFDISYVSMDDATRGFWAASVVEANARRAADDPDTAAYLGEFNSPASEHSIPILNEAGILQISPANTTVGLTRPGGGRPGEPDRYYPTGRRTFGRVVPADHLQSVALVKLMRAEGCEKVFVVAADDPYGLGLEYLIKREAAARKLRTAGGPTIGLQDDRFGPLARSVTDSRADCFVFAGSSFFHAAEVVKAVGRANPDIKLFGPDGLTRPAFTSAVRGFERRMWITSPELPRDNYPAAGRKFFEAFKARFGHSPQPIAIYGYEAMALALDAIDRSGTGGRDDIVDAFFETKDRRSVVGRYSIDANGDTTLARYGAFRPRGKRIVIDRVIDAD